MAAPAELRGRDSSAAASTPPPPDGQDDSIIRPSVTELTREVRTNILCTVEGCGKVLPNSPALRMHLVKSHRVKDGGVNPTLRKELKASRRLYCCPVEGCPRGPLRPFSQFSLVKQHFMKSHAEKKHKCVKCNNGYSTVWDLRRHAEDCGKTYRCSCGCPYASRPALLSHVYRTGHQVPSEFRMPPVKKRKMEKLHSNSVTLETRRSTDQPPPPGGAPQGRRGQHKLLLPMPRVALVGVPVVQLAHLPVLLPASDGPLRSLVLAVDGRGSLSALPFLPPPVPPPPNGEDVVPRLRPGPEAVGTGVRADPHGTPSVPEMRRGRSMSTDIQTDRSYLSGAVLGAGPEEAELSVSSCSQTDISVSAQVVLPVSVETQTCRDKTTSTSAAQTDGPQAVRSSSPSCPASSSSSPSSSSSLASSAPPLPSPSVPCRTQQTQTGGTPCSVPACPNPNPVACPNPNPNPSPVAYPNPNPLLSCDALSVSTQTLAADDALPTAGGGLYVDSRSAGALCFPSSHVADNQTQTMALLSDLENILSEQVLGHTPAGAAQDPHAASDFDFEDFLNAVHIHTQTEASELGGPGSDSQTQTDFLLLEDLDQQDAPCRAPAGELELEMFDTQTQTDLDFLLRAGSHVPLSSILRHSSFSMSTESSDTETQTDVPLPAEDAKTAVAAGRAEGLGLFLTSNQTQTAVDDFLSADLAWNVESHLSSVETQTCQELYALLQPGKRA